MIATDSEVDAGDIGVAIDQFGKDPLGVREHEALVVGFAQRTSPRVEQLEGASAMFELCVNEGDSARGEPIHQIAKEHRVGVHHCLGVAVVLRRPTFDEITADGERRTGKCEQWNVAGEFLDQQIDRVDHVADVVIVEWAEPIEVGAGAERLIGHRPKAGLDVDAETNGMRRDHDVAVEHGSVDAVALDRLQRDFSR